jgi:membrane protein DedA with SNARE-associated domain
MLTHFTQLLVSYGYTGVFTMVALESFALPIPGETVLVTAAIYAGRTHRLSVAELVLSSILGVIAGGVLGFMFGRYGGYRLLRRYHGYLHLDEPKLRLGQYLFQRYGAAVVFFGRFVALLRALAALLAGLNRMETARFMLFHALGAVAWSCLFGFGGYLLGNRIEELSQVAGTIAAIAAAAIVVLGVRVLRRNYQRLQFEADQAIGELPL